MTPACGVNVPPFRLHEQQLLRTQSSWAHNSARSLSQPLTSCRCAGVTSSVLLATTTSDRPSVAMSAIRLTSARVGASPQSTLQARKSAAQHRRGALHGALHSIARHTRHRQWQTAGVFVMSLGSQDTGAPHARPAAARRCAPGACCAPPAAASWPPPCPCGIHMCISSIRCPLRTSLAPLAALKLLKDTAAHAPAFLDNADQLRAPLVQACKGRRSAHSESSYCARRRLRIQPAVSASLMV
jgi:hypothetical protein